MSLRARRLPRNCCHDREGQHNYPSSQAFSAVFAWHGLRYSHEGMRRSSSPESAPPQGRRIAIVLLILLLIALPLYLWPLRGSGTGLPGAAAQSGSPRDPRDASAVAHIPADVWDGLMDDARSGHKGKEGRRPGNLTRFAQLEDGPGAGSMDTRSGGGALWPRDTLSRSFGALDSGDRGDGSGGSSGESPSSPTQFLASPSGNQGSGTGSGSGWSGGYSGGAGNFGPFGGGGGAGGSGGGGPFLVGDPGDSSAPAPTPEPTTILLVGSNLALLGAAAWRRLSTMKEGKPIG